MKLHITVNPADDCDRGCTHCFSESTPNKGTRMTIETMEILIEEVHKLNPEQLLWSYTGGGEPFRNPLITDLIEKPLETFDDKIVQLRVVTSGFLPENEDEIGRFINLLEKPYSGFLQLLVSFNLFNPQFPDRLKNTLSLNMKYRSRVGTTFVRQCFCCEDYGRSYYAMESAIDDFCSSTHSRILPVYTEIPKKHLDSLCGLFLPKKRLVRRSDEEMSEEGLRGEKNRYKWEWLKEFWSTQQEKWLTDEAFLYDHYSWVGNPMYGAFPLIYQSFSLAKIGRAAKLRKTPICDFFCETLMDGSDNSWDRIIVGANGGLYPQMECCGSKRMLLGKLGQDSLREALQRKREFSAVIVKEILKDKRIFDRDTDVCKICKSIKFRLKL